MSRTILKFYNDRGVVLTDLEKFDDALRDFEKAISLKPDYTEALKNQHIAREAKKGINLERLKSINFGK